MNEIREEMVKRVKSVQKLLGFPSIDSWYWWYLLFSQCEVYNLLPSSSLHVYVEYP